MKCWTRLTLLAVAALGMMTVAGMATAAETKMAVPVQSTAVPVQSTAVPGQGAMPMAVQTPMPLAPATMNSQDWQRFYHYPYVYYPHNFYGPEYFKASPFSMMRRYPPEMQIPKYRRDWVNFYPQPKKYYQGYGFRLDIF